MLVNRLRRSLSVELMSKINSPNKTELFACLNLQDIGLNLNCFNALRLGYNNLPIDHNFPNGNTNIPTRCRRYANFDVHLKPNDLLTIQQNQSYLFQQEVKDFRKKTRVFQPMETTFLNYYFADLITNLTELVCVREPLMKRCNISVHQVRLISYPECNSDNAPEGMHQDGVDYIVSALVLNKHNIQDDESIIYDQDKQEIFRKSLAEGEFIFQEDRNLWHDITPIKAKEGYLGYRDILGFDFKLLE